MKKAFLSLPFIFFSLHPNPIASSTGFSIISGPITIQNPGTYRLSKGTITGPVTIQSDDVVLNLNGNVIDGSPEHGIVLKAQHNIVIENGSIRHAHDSGINIIDSYDILLKNIFIDSNIFDGIHIQNSDRIYIEECVISNNNQNGISLISSFSNTICNSIIKENMNAGIFTYQSGCNVIKNCVSLGHAQTGAKIYASFNTSIMDCRLVNNAIGIYLATSNNNHIEKNELLENQGCAIEIESSSNNQIKENICLSTQKTGILISNNLNLTAEGNTIEQNIISFNDQGIFIANTGDPLPQKNLIIHNIITENTNSGIANYGLNSNTIFNNRAVFNGKNYQGIIPGSLISTYDASSRLYTSASESDFINLSVNW